MPFKDLLTVLREKFVHKGEEASAFPPAGSAQPLAPAPPPPAAPTPAAPEPPKKYLFAGHGSDAKRATPVRQTASLHPALSRIQQQDQSSATQKAEIVARIETMFGEFGIAVCSYMLTQSMTPGGVGRVLKKLGLPSRGRDSADMIQIENWILKEGAETFCSRVGIRHEGNAHFPPSAPPPHHDEPSSGYGSHAPMRPVPSPATPAQGIREVGIGRGAEKIARPTPKEEGHQDKSHIKNVDVEPIGLQGKNLVSRREMKYGVQETAPPPEAYIPPPPQAPPPPDDGTDAPITIPTPLSRNPTPAPIDRAKPVQLTQDPLKPVVKLNGGQGKRLRNVTAETDPYPDQLRDFPGEGRPQEPAPPAKAKPPADSEEKTASFYPRRIR